MEFLPPVWTDEKVAPAHRPVPLPATGMIRMTGLGSGMQGSIWLAHTVRKMVSTWNWPPASGPFEMFSSVKVEVPVWPTVT